MTFHYDPAFEKALLADEEWRAFALAKAGEASKLARDLRRTHPGFQHWPDWPRGEATDKGANMVIDGPFWHLEEFGTPESPPYAPIRKGVEGAGMRFVRGHDLVVGADE